MYIEETLNKLARRGRELRQKLFFEPYPIASKQGAQKYIELHTEYDFIADLFAEMQAYDWLKEDFSIKL